MATATLSRSRGPVGPLTEARALCRSGHLIAATCLAKVAVDSAMSDLAIAVRPTLKKFHNGKRLSAFLRSEGAIDGKLAGDVSAHVNRVYELTHRPTGRRGDVLQLIASAQAIVRILRTSAERRLA